MGQKVNPHGLRVGVIKDWDSRWYARNEKVGDLLVEDKKIRDYLKKTLYSAGIPKIEIERTIDNATSKPRIRVTIHCAKPGMVIGRQGAEKEKIQAQLSKMTGKDVLVNIVEVNNMSTNAQLVAEDIASQLERRIARLETGMAWAEEPPSRTRHLISNLQISETDVPDVFAVRLNYLLYRAQKERDETFYVGTRVDKVRRLPGDEWRLLAREIVLDQAVITSHNLSVLF